MRAGPLSDSRVIALLNHYFVPVYSSNEEFEIGGTAPPEERAERARIFAEFTRARMGTGDVHVYILSPEGHAFDGLDIGRAVDPDLLIQALERTVQRLRTRSGEPAVKPARQSVPPRCASDALVFHLIARGFNKGSWREFPAENWVVLSQAEWKALLPSGNARVGTSWEIEKKLAAKLLANFYPQMEEKNSAERGRIDQQSLRLTLVSEADGVAIARIDGSLRMKRTFAPSRQDNNFVNAILVGFMEFEPGKQRIRRLRLVTQKAVYAQEEFAAGLRSLSPEEVETLSH